MIDQILPFFVIAPVIIAVFLYVFFTMRVARIIAITFQGLFIVPAILLLAAARETEIISIIGDYEGLLGITLRADNLAAVFILLTVAVFLAVGIYTIKTPYDRSKRLYLFLIFLLEGSLIGLFLARDFFNIFVLVEVSTVVVTILLMYDRSRRNLFAGMTFIMVNIIVMQFYLFGLGYMYMMTGVMDMEAAATAIAAIDDRTLALPYALIMTSIAAKCSLLPMLTWLPKVNAFTGSRFTIAAIISALHIKGGIYLFIRFQEIFGGMAMDFFLIIGIVTAISGIVMALAQTEIRLLLAYSTIAQVGLIIAGLSLGDDYSFIGSLFHIVNHTLFKLALFLCASQISYYYKTKDIRQIRGALRTVPRVAIANIMVIFGIVGAPIFNGSISKYFLAYGATGFFQWIIILINFGTILVFIKYSVIFFGKPLGEVSEAKPDWDRLSVVFGLAGCCLLLGIFGTQSIQLLFNQQVNLDMWGYLEKSVIFAVSVGVGFVVYRKFIENKDFLRPLNDLNMSFHKICVSMGVFFAVLVIYVGVL